MFYERFDNRVNSTAKRNAQKPTTQPNKDTLFVICIFEDWIIVLVIYKMHQLTFIGIKEFDAFVNNFIVEGIIFLSS